MSIIGATHLISELRKQRRHEVKKMECYELRNRRLKNLGYANYVEYRESDQWKKLRARVIQRHPKCTICSRPASQVHHMDYGDKTLLGLNGGALASLCGYCHEEIEIDERGDKRDLFSANMELFRRASSIGKQDWVDRTKLLLNRLLDEQDIIDEKDFRQKNASDKWIQRGIKAKLRREKKSKDKENTKAEFGRCDWCRCKMRKTTPLCRGCQRRFGPPPPLLSRHF